jgi:hypothetical protein
VTEPTLTPEEEARATELLAGLRESEAPPARADLAAVVARRAHWQRGVRHVLVSLGATAGGFATGLAALTRGRRR